ncbi:carnosine synthase 1 [Amia ocellicauda]|uniref:carnosine synthase 1 n=1 Tax=Amia ocellicauda TaxID=2972642 RepID=UPI00346391D5
MQQTAETKIDHEATVQGSHYNVVEHLSHDGGDGSHLQQEDAESAQQLYHSLQQILLELGLPETRDRTTTPRALTTSELAICVLSSPDKYLPVLLEGGRLCSGHMLLCLSSTWLSKIPSPEHPGLFSLRVHKAITFEAGGHTYLDSFQPPCRVSYFLSSLGSYSTQAQDKEGPCLDSKLEADLDCPACGSPQLSRITENMLLTRQLLSQKGVGIPQTLAFFFHPPPTSWPPHPSITVVSVQLKEQLQELMPGAIDTFLQHPELQSCHEVIVQPSGGGWYSCDNETTLVKRDREGVLSATLALLPRIQEGESILISASYESVQPQKPLKLEQSIAYKAPEVLRKLALRIRATVCRAADDQPQLSQVVCWVDKAEAPASARPTVLQTLEVTLQEWGFTQDDLTAIQQIIKQWAEAAMQAVMDYQSQLSDQDKGGAGAQTDLIGVEFALIQQDGKLRPLLLRLTAHHRGVYSTAFSLLMLPRLAHTVEPLLQTMCQRAHSFFIAGKTILVIGAGGSLKMSVWHTAKKQNIRIILVNPESDHPAIHLVWKFLHYNFTDHSEDEAHSRNIASMIRESNLNINGCLTFVCNCSVLTSILCKELGLPSNGVEMINIAKKKSHTQQHLGRVAHSLQHFPDVSLYTVPCLQVNSPAELQEVIEKVDFPAVMKLEYGEGGLGVKMVENPQQCEEFYDSIKQQKDLFSLGITPEVMLMEYVGGEKHVVDLIIFCGKLLAAFVSDYGPSGSQYFLNLSHIMPSKLCPEKVNQLVTAAYQSCIYCGLKNGVFNVDLKMTETGPKLLEINPRTGGIYMPAWVKAVYGFDLILVSFLIACDIRPHAWTPEPRGHIAGLSTPMTQYLQALENPSFTATLKHLEANRIIHSIILRDGSSKFGFEVVSLNLSSFSHSKEEVFKRLLIVSEILGLDSKEYPFKYFLDPLM